MILILIFLLGVCSCSKIFNDDTLTLGFESNTSNALSLEGYYFSEFESDEP